MSIKSLPITWKIHNLNRKIIKILAYSHRAKDNKFLQSKIKLDRKTTTPLLKRFNNRITQQKRNKFLSIRNRFI